MGKDVQLYSREWVELIFESKNKTYGAYQLRLESWRHHAIAFGFAVLFCIMVWAVPQIVSMIEQAVKERRERLGTIDTEVKLTDLEDQKIPDENIIKQELEQAPPPPPLKSTIKFTPPVITDDENVRDDEQMLSQDKLQDSKVQISIASVDGVDSPDAIDIAELEEHKVVVAQDEPFYAVEQMPQFPGGNNALQKYLAEHVHYPTLAAENNVQGRVVVRFVVTPKGEIDKVEILQSLDRLCDEEAMRVVRSMPKWIPGRHNGRPVPVVYTVPIIFKLQ